tara:strand:+ start:120 stop:347 length:228 start_codon:yes stop_codon:yes gene_type:complete
VKNPKFQERLKLLNEARERVVFMRNKNVFVLDVGAMEMLERLSDEFQNLLTENVSLQKEIKLLKVFGSKKKKSKT